MSTACDYDVVRSFTAREAVFVLTRKENWRKKFAVMVVLKSIVRKRGKGNSSQKTKELTTVVGSSSNLGLNDLRVYVNYYVGLGKKKKTDTGQVTRAWLWTEVGQEICFLYESQSVCQGIREQISHIQRLPGPDMYNEGDHAVLPVLSIRSMAYQLGSILRIILLGKRTCISTFLDWCSLLKNGSSCWGT